MNAMICQLVGLLAISATLARSTPIFRIDDAQVLGSDTGNAFAFLGLPYALPPVGDLRFRKPQPIPPYTGIINAVDFGPSCPQQPFEVPFLSGLPRQVVDFFANIYLNAQTPQSEDCLTINVFTPDSVTSNSRLPVAVYFYGGGFETGSSKPIDGSTFVGTDMIFVTFNYRVSGFGFLASKEVRDAGAGNLGLQDQREALRWVRKYISSFGGDPDKVTIWGVSAGAISISLHMVANDGNNENLFRAAIMESGAPIPVGDITNGQVYYDQIVADTGCAGSSDTLACLRTVPYSRLKPAIDKIPSIFDYQATRLAWLPRADGTFLTAHPQALVAQGKIARVPFITGNCDDEGTLFSFSTLNITTDAQFRQYIKEVYIPGINDDQLNTLALHYADDIQKGSPFGTGIFNAITPEFKRISALQGDLAFQAPRRWFLQHTSGQQPIWVYLSKRLKLTPIIGSSHASLLQVGGDLKGYLRRFVKHLDPNDNSLLGTLSYKWPQYTTEKPSEMILNDGLIPMSTGQDTFRLEAMNFLTNLSLVLPI